MKRRRLIALQLLLVIAATTVAFLPSLRNGFTNWDDPELLLQNPAVKGLTPAHLRLMFTHTYAGFGGYTPLVLLSYSFENRFFGLNPRVFHFDNLALHVLCAVLIYVLTLLLTGNTWIGFAVGAVFGVHPLHVEAVAWVQGRKDLLFSLFFLAAAISYLLHLRRKGRRGLFYGLALFLFGCSLFSKVAAISFPLVAMLLESHERQVLDKEALRRLVPFLALAAVFLVLAFLTMSTSPHEIPVAKVHRTYWQNLGLFFYAFVFYLGKIFLPLRLTARYPANFALYPLDLYLNLAVFALACGVLYLAYRRERELTRLGISFFILTLMPTLPFHFGGQPYADRYTYLPLAGILIAVAALAISRRPEARPLPKPAVIGKAAALGLIVLLLAAQTQALSRIWHDSYSLWTHVLRYNPQSAVAYLNRSQAAIDANELDRARADLDKALELDPENPKVYLNRGVVAFMKEDYASALAEFDKCVKTGPQYHIGYFNRGMTWGRLKHFDKAVEDMTEAIRVEKYFAPAYYYRGLAYKELGQPDRALADFRTAYRLGPNETLRKEIEGLSGRPEKSAPPAPAPAPKER